MPNKLSFLAFWGNFIVLTSMSVLTGWLKFDAYVRLNVSLAMMITRTSLDHVRGWNIQKQSERCLRYKNMLLWSTTMGWPSGHRVLKE